MPFWPFEEGIVTEVESALMLLKNRSGMLCTGGEEGAYIVERVHHDRDSGGSYTTSGERFWVSAEVVAELKRRRMVEPEVIMGGPLRNRLEISEVGSQWLTRERARRRADAS